MKKITLIILFTVLGACGSNPHKVVAVKVGDDLYKPDRSAAMALDTGSKERIICEKRIRTGSHRKERTCSTAAEKARERKAAEDTITNNDTLITRRIVQDRGGR